MEKLQKIDFILFLLFFTSLVFPLRAVSSVCIGLIIISGIVKKIAFKTGFTYRHYLPLVVSCTALFLLQFISLPYTNDPETNWNKIILKSGLLLVPVAAIFAGSLDARIRHQVMKVYILLLLAAAAYCIAASFIEFGENKDAGVFFYHQLAAQINQHAVYLSVLVFAGIIYLLENLRAGNNVFKRPWEIISGLLLIIFTVLLSSRLVIAFLIIYLLVVTYFIVVSKKTRPVIIVSALLFLGTFFVLLLLPNPVSKRFREITGSRMENLNKTRYDAGTYFDGLQFRVLQWKWVSEILDEKKAWLKGVTPGDAQHELDSLYASKKMHEGYQGYNTHNQALESLLQNGIPGLFLFLMAAASVLYQAAWKEYLFSWFFALLLVTWSFLESVFETQYGILIFCFFPVWVNLLRASSDK